MIAPPAPYRKGWPGAFVAALNLTNTLGKIIMPPHLRPGRAPENCEKKTF
jgi:hypothetical protein